MHARRHTRATRLAVALAAPFALLLALPTTAHATEPVSPPAPGTTAPASVLASVAPGGEAFRAAMQSVAVEGDGPVPTAQSTTLGPPHVLIDYTDTRRASSELGGDELVTDTGAVEWLVVETRDGSPVGITVVDDDGHVVSSGAWPSATGRTVESLPADAQLLRAGTPVERELYVLSADRRTVTPVDDTARETSGAEPLTAPEFRTAQRDAYATWVAESDGGVPQTPRHGTDIALFFSILGTVAAGGIVWAVLAGRRRHRLALGA